MTPFFNSPERIELLRNSISGWMGTPFFPNCAIKGIGVSCQQLVGAVLKECGVFPADLKIPEAPMKWARANKDSLVIREISKRPELQPIYDRSGQNRIVPVLARGPGLSSLPGDVLGLKWGGCVQHLALIFNEFVAVHVLKNHSVCQASLTDATLLGQIEIIWRPVEL